MSGRSVWRSEGRSIDEKGWVPLRYWSAWFFGLGLAVATFYVILTPIWIGLRGVAPAPREVHPDRVGDEGVAPADRVAQRLSVAVPQFLST